MKLRGNLPPGHDALLFSINGTGYFYMPSHTDMARHTKAFIYLVMDHWGESQSALAQGRFEPPTYRSTVEHAIHQTTITAP